MIAHRLFNSHSLFTVKSRVGFDDGCRVETRVDWVCPLRDGSCQTFQFRGERGRWRGEIGCGRALFVRCLCARISDGGPLL